MKQDILHWLDAHNWPHADWIYGALVALIILLTSLVLHFVLHSVVLRLLSQSAKSSQLQWRRTLYRHRLLSRVALVLQGAVLIIQVHIWLPADSILLTLTEQLAGLWIILYLLLALYSLLDTVEDLAQSSRSGRRLPLRGIFQSIKLVAALIALILAISRLIGESPLILLSGLGAMTAVMSLLFKDTILGFVAGIQLSANKMLSVGDWLEMPKYGADGDVIDISLTTVKVRNWDNTITTIPAYSLIADSFKNWRGMSESGGRRIKRALYIDATSVKFLQPGDIEQLRQAHLLSQYIEQKLADIEQDNQSQAVDLSCPVNGRRLTNLGTFRAYLTAYLRDHKQIHQDMTYMVRQLESGPQGIPLEIYAFSRDIVWVNYEAIQADIFDHIFAVVSAFGLRIYQAPSGYDMQQIGLPTGRVAAPVASDSASG